MVTLTIRPWRGALWAWLGMDVCLTLLALIFGARDIDFSPGWPGRVEAVQVVWLYFALPLGLLSFGALAPMGFTLHRLGGASLRRWQRALLGIVFALPAFIAFVVMTEVPQRLGLLGSKRSTLMADLSAIAHRPAQAVPFLLLFALGGVIFMLASQPVDRARRESAIE